MKEVIAAGGFRVSAPCLPGHDGGFDELSRVTWEDWYEEVRKAYKALRKETELVYCAGISLGALLCMKLALDEGWGVRAMVLMATSLSLSRVATIGLNCVRYTPLRWFVHAFPKNLNKNIADPEGRVVYGELSQPMMPARAVYELADLQRELKPNLSRITNPVLLIHGQGDLIAPPSNVDFIRKSIASDVVETIILPRSRHVITMDYEKDRVALATLDFFKKFA